MRALQVLLLVLLLVGCGNGDDDGTPARARPLITTTFQPITFITRALVGDAADVVCPMPADADPGHWTPTREALATFQGADLLIYNGARYEAWMKTASLPRAIVVDTTADLDEPFIKLKESAPHAHGGGKTHTHSTRDGHTWVDPMTLKQQAAEALRALRKLLPRHDFTAAADALNQQLDDLDAAFRGLGSLPEGEVLAASHPSYNYLARRYGWTMVNFLFDPGSKLDDAAVTEVRESLQGRRARFFLWEDTPTDEAVSRLKSLGLTSVVVRPGHRPVTGETYLSLMRKNVEALRPAFAP